MIETTFLFCSFFFTFILIILRNRFDLFLILFGSTTIYHWQILYGQIWVPPYSFEVGEEAKIIVSIVYLSICFGIFLNEIDEKFSFRILSKLGPTIRRVASHAAQAMAEWGGRVVKCKRPPKYSRSYSFLLYQVN